MTRVLRFYRDEKTRVPRFEAVDDSYGPLGSLMTSDVQLYDKWALDILDGIARVQRGDETLAEWEGNGWSGEIRPDGFHLEDLHSDDWRGDYDLQLAREVTLDYLRFLLADASARSLAVDRWEREEGRPHPARADVEASPS